MKQQLFIVTVLTCLVLTNQEDWENEGMDFWDHLNMTFPPYVDTLPPCSITVPGLSSLGLMVTFIIVFVLSLVGNSVIVLVVFYMKKGRASTDLYLMHLAMADLLFSVTLPFWAVDNHYGWIFGTFLCKLMSSFQEAAVYSGVFLLACISVDRYFAIVRATRFLSSHHLMVKILCGVVWLVAGILSLPVAIQRESLYAKDLRKNICYENLTGESSDHWRVGVRVTRHTMGFFLPLGVMVFCYGWTVAVLFHTRNRQKQKAMRVILAVVLAFIVCWLPHNIVVLIDTLIRGETIQVASCKVQNMVEAFFKVTEVLAFLHCAVNPFLYAFIGQKFRNELLSVLNKHGLITKRMQMAYRKGSAGSAGSNRSRNTSDTL